MKKYLIKIKALLVSLIKFLTVPFLWVKNKPEFFIGILAAGAWFLFWLMSRLIGTETYPVGYFQKIAFGLMAMSVISAVTFFWLKETNRFFFDLLDPDKPDGIENLTEWEKIKVGLFWFAFFGGGTVLLAALY